jgi:hypothetical protein
VLKSSEERKIERARDAAQAMAEYHAQQAHTAANTARLKALRLAEADRHPLAPSEHPTQANKPAGDIARKGAVKQRFPLDISGEKKRAERQRKGPSDGQFMDPKQ